jgi:hypothetical protein
MHVILRGIDRTAVFFEEGNCRFFLDRARAAALKRRAAGPIAGCAKTN